MSAPENREVVQTAVPGAVFASWDSADAVSEAIDWAHAVAVGPGLGTGDEESLLARRIVEDRDPTAPLVIDADGLSAFAGEPEALGPVARGPTLLTPHPGELARLMGGSIDDVTTDPLAAARRAASVTGCTVLLKGTPAWVVDPSGAARATVHASPAFAGGGMGDVLAGVCGAILARGLAPADAAGAALVLSGLAVLGAGSGAGVMAEDVPDLLPEGRRRLRQLDPGGWAGLPLVLPAAVASKARPAGGAGAGTGS